MDFFKLASIYRGDKLKSLLDFGDLDLIFKVIASFEPVDGFSSNLQQYITVTSLRADKILVTLTPFSRS